jgi:small nuclear ribonucleoprotein B and B'
MPTGSKGSKLLRYIEHRLRVSLVDGRTIVGTFLAFDKHLNLVLVDAEEYRYAKKSGSSSGSGSAKMKSSAIIEERVEKRTLGLIILRGENVVSVAVDGPPPPSMKAASAAAGVSGPGVARGVGRGALPPSTATNGGGGAGRGYGGAPMGLGAAPVHGVGGMGGMGMPPPIGGMGMMPPPPPGGMMGRGMPPPGMGRGGGY